MAEKPNPAAAARPVGPFPMGFGPGRGPVLPVERSKNTGPTLRRLWGYLGRQRTGLITVVVCTALSAALALVGPYLIGVSINRYVIARHYAGFLQTCLLLLAVYAAGSGVQWVQQYIMVGVGQRTVRAMRQDLFAKFQTLPVRFFDSTTHGELMSRTTNDILNVSNTLNQGVVQVVSSVFTLVGSLVVMLDLNWELTVAGCVTVPLVFLATARITRYTRRYFAGQQRSLGEANSYIEETISGQKVVAVFHREQTCIREFARINGRLRHEATQAQIFSGMIGPVMNVLGNLNFAIISIAGGWMAVEHRISIGLIVSFLSYSRQFSMPINQLASQYNMIQSAIAGAERVFEVLDAESEYREGEGVDALEGVQGHVAFEDVSFAYQEGVPVLRDVTLAARPGDTIALVGPTGAGKTTVINLLTRFYEVDGGAIAIDGTDIRRLHKDGLRRQLGIVLQDAYVFSDTIRENIRYGRLDATDHEVEAAAALANADGFIRRLPHGYDTHLSAEGGNLSQGQRQLITIARAILADPAVLILDEATSSVDTRTEMHIQEAMRTLRRGRTSFVIAHRLSTVRDADTILVFHGGRIIERGSHADLLAQKGFYHDLYTSQFTRALAAAGE